MSPPVAAVRHPQVDGRSLTRIAFDRLRDEVIRGLLRPGERLRVQPLSSRYGIGATAIREALSRLISDGLVQLEDHRGFVVAPVSRSDLIDLTEARVEIEALVLRRAIAHGDTAWEAGVLASLHRLAKCAPSVTPDAAASRGRLHRVFHESLLAGCGSHWLITLCHLLYDQSERYRCLADIGPTAPSANRDDEHAALTDAVLTRDGEAASALLARHYRATTEIILGAETVAVMFAAAPDGGPRARASGAAVRHPHIARGIA